MGCELTGWLQRADCAPEHSEWKYFELFSNGTALVYPSPHRNKLRQALCAVVLAHCSVQADPKDPGKWLIRDEYLDGAVWRCQAAVKRPGITVEQVLDPYVRTGPTPLSD